jgi:hypothetical protein
VAQIVVAMVVHRPSQVTEKRRAVGAGYVQLADLSTAGAGASSLPAATSFDEAATMVASSAALGRQDLGGLQSLIDTGQRIRLALIVVGELRRQQARQGGAEDTASVPDLDAIQAAIGDVLRSVAHVLARPRRGDAWELVVWDREFGFLREMLVAPVWRGSIVIGKCFGGASVAVLQGVLVVAVAPLVGVPYSLTMILGVIGLQLLLAFTLTSFGLMIAVRIKQIQSFMAINQMLVMPLYFISGALFPVAHLPAWLAVLNRLDPLTYAVDPIRHVVFARLDINPAARAALDPGVTWGSWVVPPLLEAAIVAAIGLVLLGVAIARFSKEE